MPLTKFVPVTVIGKELLPAMAEVTLSDVAVGPLTANVVPLGEVVGPVPFVTAIAGVPAVPSWVSPTEAVTWVELT